MLYSRAGCSRAGSKGPATLPHLSGELFAVLEQEPAKGPAAHGWPDQKWTLDGGMTAAAPDAWLAFEDEARFSMAPAKARTWSRRRITPVICIRGRSRRHISIAALACYRPGHRSRLIYRSRYDDGDDEALRPAARRQHQEADGPYRHQDRPCRSRSGLPSDRTRGARSARLEQAAGTGSLSRIPVPSGRVVGHAAGRGKFETHWSRCWLRYWSH
ncbi:hypothetical protein ACFY2W_34685 [Streptomyces sp. NPDC001262]|uniref:hypothetical protein n=1 Tax=Streptomyces sp. NPDC001262 TaxID=3364552 RepID=UPI0036CC0046